jgi:nitroreductase
MEGLLKLIKERRSIRNFTSQNIPIQEIYELLEAARWAPSGGNVQPLRYVIVASRETIEAIKMVSPGLFGEPPVIIVMCFNEDKILSTSQIHFIDLGAALQNILLMAHSKGIGCCPVASFDAEAVAELLSLPNKIKPVLLLALGYPDGHPSPPSRLPLDELIVGRV